MTYLTDRMIIIGLTLYFFFLTAEDVEPVLLPPSESAVSVSVVVVVLLLLGFSCLLSYVDSRKSRNVIAVVYGAAAMLMPSFAVLSPVVVYDIFGSRLYGPAVLLLAAVFHAGKCYAAKILGGTVILSAIACLLNCRSTKNERLDAKVKQIRDDSQEMNLLLTEKNKSLIEKQDNELYVATLKERNRIAREIHDNVGHMLTRSILQMGALMSIYKEEPLCGQLSSVKDSLDVAMNNVRESVHDLHDESVDLKSAVSEAVAPLKDNFEYRLEYDMSNSIDRKYKYAIIGIVKEAVSNIIKYSKNKKVDIILREHPAMFQLVIQDYGGEESGAGIGKRAAQTSGIGLQNMRDRVEALNGNITITADNGYRIFATMPKNREGGIL